MLYRYGIINSSCFSRYSKVYLDNYDGRGAPQTGKCSHFSEHSAMVRISTKSQPSWRTLTKTKSRYLIFFIVSPLMFLLLESPNFFTDPVPSDLLVKFLTLSVEPSTEDTFEKSQNFKCSKRQLSMKILALKIVAFWKWDLETIESK